MTSCIDVVARDERGDENTGSDHCSVYAVDSACRLFCASPFRSLVPFQLMNGAFYAGYELRTYVVRPRKIRHLVRQIRSPPVGTLNFP